MRTTLWVVPVVAVVAVVGLWVVTYTVDQAAYRGDLTLPGWLNTGSADAARLILTTILTAVITVVGVVFSITILAMTLASTQFGPRILGNFVRDRGTQLTLGTFVATVVYAILSLGSIHAGSHGEFVPHLSITACLVLVLFDVIVLVYFIDHMATSIQLPVVIGSIANDFNGAIDDYALAAVSVLTEEEAGTGLVARIRHEGVPIAATSSGYLQFIEYADLVPVAVAHDAVLLLWYRPGHFVIEGSPMASVLPASAAPALARTLTRGHATGRRRTLSQDPALAIDQLVEIAIRALSPAVNDTFSALTCIDWLTDGLCRASDLPLSEPVYRDIDGNVRVILARLGYERVVDRAFHKIRQAGRGNPAVAIRQLDSLAKLMACTPRDDQREALISQADMILRGSETAIPEESDRADVRRSYDRVIEQRAQASR